MALFEGGAFYYIFLLADKGIYAIVLNNGRKAIWHINIGERITLTAGAAVVICFLITLLLCSISNPIGRFTQA
eukprot:scaffold1473_cov206-Chaetoceros_neogracile.AAC.2